VGRRMGLDETLLIKVSVVAPDVRVTGEDTCDVQYVVEISLTDRRAGLLNVGMELAGSDDLDILKQEVMNCATRLGFISDLSTIKSV